MDILHNGLILPDDTPTGGPATTVLNLQDGTGISWGTTRKAGVVIATPSVVSAALPGSEIGYDQVTIGIDVVSTTESAGTTIIACSPHTFDGSPVMCHFFSPLVGLPTVSAGFVVISLFEGATQIGELSWSRTGVATSTGGFYHTVSAFLRFTPSAGSHTYIVTAFTNSTTGSPSVSGGPGGTGQLVPMFVRFTKV